MESEILRQLHPLYDSWCREDDPEPVDEWEESQILAERYADLEWAEAQEAQYE